MSLRAKAALGAILLAVAVVGGYFLGEHLVGDRLRDEEIRALDTQINAIKSQTQQKVAVIEKKKQAIHVASEATPEITRVAELPGPLPLISDAAVLSQILALQPQLPQGPLAILSQENSVKLVQRLLTCEQHEIELDACLKTSTLKDQQIKLAKGGNWLRRTAKPLAIGGAIAVALCAASGKCGAR